MRSPRGSVAALFVTVALLATGCGTRASDGEVRAGVGAGGPVQLPPEVLDQLKSAGTVAPGVAGAPAVTDLPTGTDTSSVPVTKPGKGGTAPAAGITTTGSTGSTATATTPSKSAACTGSGTPLNIGQIGSFSGVLGPVTSSARNALAVWVKHVNARGGLACHPVVLYAVDDGADPSRAAALVQQLVAEKKIQAIVALFAPLSMAGIIPAITKAKLPVVGGDAIDFEWTKQPLLFPQGAGLEGAIDGSLRQTVGQGKTKLGLIYCVESSICTSAAKIIPPRAEAAGAKIVYSSAVSLTQTDFTAQCQNAKNAGVQSIGMAVDGSSIGRFARSCAALGYYPQFVSGGGVISAAQARDPGIRKNGLSVSSANAPWMLTDTPGQKEYAEALAKYSPGTETEGNSMAAWAAAKLFEAAIGNLGASARSAPITSADILTGLGKIKNETLDGLSPPITFSPGQKAAPVIKCIYFELLTEKGWTAPNGSKFVCT